MARSAATFRFTPLHAQPPRKRSHAARPQSGASRRYTVGTRVACLLALLASSAAAGDSLRASAYPRTILAGGSVRLTCSVPRDPDHRWLEMGIEGLRTSGGDLEGDRAAVTHVMLLDHVPCGTEEAFCRVDGAVNKPERAVSRFAVGGCVEEDQESPFTR